MIPIEKVQDIIAKHDKLEKDLSAGSVDPKLFAQKSKEYSSLGNIISIAREYVKFDGEVKDLENIMKDKDNDKDKVVYLMTSYLIYLILAMKIFKRSELRPWLSPSLSPWL